MTWAFAVSHLIVPTLIIIAIVAGMIAAYLVWPYIRPLKPSAKENEDGN